MYVPESNTLRRSLLSLARSSEKKREQDLRSRSSITTGNIDDAVESADEQPFTSTADETISGGWRRHTDESLGEMDHSLLLSTKRLSLDCCKTKTKSNNSGQSEQT